MQVMAVTTIGLLVAAAFIGGVAMRRQELYLSASTTGTRVAIVLAASAVVIAGTLAIGQRQVCTALGGRWASDNQACRNEWGGNDGDIPGSFSRGPILFGPRR